MTFPIPWVVLWLAVWLIAGAPRISYDPPGSWEVALVICALIDLTNGARR